MRPEHVLTVLAMKTLRTVPAVRVPISDRGLIAAVTLGVLAVAALLGAFSQLPPALSFFLSALPVILFPGTVIAAVLRPAEENGTALPEYLAVAFVCGLASLALAGFIGIVFKLGLHALTFSLTVLFAALLVLLVLQRMLAGSRESRAGGVGGGLAVTVLVAAAVLLAAATLWSPRDMDDWFYLAYIADYVEGQPVNSTDALMGPDWAAPPRAWFGAWWVAEALLTSASGAHPVDCHQVYIPILILPFAVFAVFTLARRVFRSRKAAYLICFLQVLFYLSSAYPSDTAGWALFARAAQDKSLAFLIPATVAASLGLTLIRRSHTYPGPPDWRLYGLYFISAVTAGLVHPMGIVWCGVALLPFAAVEVLRDRRRRTLAGPALLVIPLALCALMLRPGAEATSLLKDITPGPHEGRGISTILAPYVPGDMARPTAGDRILTIDDGTYIAHPLLVTRYPMAWAGLVLTPLLLIWWRRSRTARFLVVLTTGVLILAYVPGIAGLTSGLITRKMLYRLTWLLPWGFTVGFFLTRTGLRLRWAWVIALVAMMLLSRGNPRNFFMLMVQTREGGRPAPEFVEAAAALASEPAPRGVVLAASNIGMMLPAYVSEAYPAFVSPAYSTVYRSERIRTPADLRDLLAFGIMEESFMDILDDIRCRYIMERMSASLAIALRAREPEFRPVFINSEYGLWGVPRSHVPRD
jgi:hypothetical protein